MKKSSVDRVFNIYKPIGDTPFRSVQKLKERYPEFNDVKVGYAGRLDPLAHGVLILMVGEACKRRDFYQDLPKTYQFDLLLGFKTDSYDPLGIIEKQSPVPLIDEYLMKSILKQYEGEFLQEYPPYSSFHVEGKPLYKWAKEGKLNEIVIPSKKVSIESAKIKEIKNLKLGEIINEIIIRVSKIEGEFRQKEIIDQWEKLLTSSDINALYPIITIVVETSSGTYVRSIADSIGETLKCGGIALEIYRTAVGLFRVEDSINLSDSVAIHTSKHLVQKSLLHV